MNRKEALRLVDMPIDELLLIANKTRKASIGNKLEVCGIINAKSGACSENCKFCAQSSHYSTCVPEYPLKGKDEIVSAAIMAKENGADRFGIVTSGNKLTDEELQDVAEAVRNILSKADIPPCASLGALGEKEFSILKDAGLTRFHHNIETSEKFYPEIVTTHDYSERVNTIKAAKEAGLEVCSGGIFGMGETWEDRIDMAFLLKDLEVDSIPMNFLVPVTGTPLENATGLSPFEAVRTIALFRVIMPTVTLKVVAGRESVLKDFQAMIFLAGANGMMVGGYLTIAGRSVEEDNQLLSEVKTLWAKE